MRTFVGACRLDDQGLVLKLGDLAGLIYDLERYGMGADPQLIGGEGGLLAEQSLLVREPGVLSDAPGRVGAGA